MCVVDYIVLLLNCENTVLINSTITHHTDELPVRRTLDHE